MTTTLPSRDHEIVLGVSKRGQWHEERRARGLKEIAATREGFFTHDLALAAVLSMQGYDTSNLIWRRQDRRIAEWFFERDDQLDEIVREFRSGSHLVEPTRFIKNVRLVRRQLYTFLDQLGGSRDL